jgi:hypothetical protein
MTIITKALLAIIRTLHTIKTKILICPINEIQKKVLGKLDYLDTNPQMHLETNVRLNTDPILKRNFQSF